MFKIFKAQEKKEPEVFLRLVSGGEEGKVCVAMVNEKGTPIEGGYLINFNSNGTYSRPFRVTTKHGIQRIGGKIKERT